MTQNLPRRNLLKAAAGLGAAGLTSKASAQVYGTMEGGGTVPLRAPLGALDYLDRNQYISNMEIIAHIPGAAVSGGEPMTAMWAKGKRRLISGGGAWLDVTEPKKAAMVAKDAYQGSSNVTYNIKLKKWILMASAQVPLTEPSVKYPRGKYAAENAARSTSYTGLRGIRTYDATDPMNVKLLQEYDTGKTGSGTHMNFYDGGQYAFLDCGWDNQLRQESSERPYSNALMIVDMSDPAHVKEVSRWWAPGQKLSEEETYRKYFFAGDQSSWSGNHGGCTVPVRVEDGGKIGYGGWGVFGMYVHDLSDIKNPKIFGHVRHPLENMGGIPFHTCFPVIADARAYPKLQNLIVGVFEALEGDCREPFHTCYTVDVKDPKNPRIIGLFPRPLPDPKAPYADFCMARGRFSSHNIQTWIAPGQARPDLVALTYFNAGLRIYDISDPTAPKEVAYFVPPRDGDMSDYATWRRGTTENVFIEWDRNLIWVGTHEGVYCLSAPFLGKPVLEPQAVKRWTVPHANAGWDA